MSVISWLTSFNILWIQNNQNTFLTGHMFLKTKLNTRIYISNFQLFFTNNYFWILKPIIVKFIKNCFHFILRSAYLFILIYFRKLNFLFPLFSYLFLSFTSLLINNSSLLFSWSEYQLLEEQLDNENQRKNATSFFFFTFEERWVGIIIYERSSVACLEIETYI